MMFGYCELPFEFSNPLFCFVLSYEWSLLIWYHDFFSAKVVVELGKSFAFIKVAALCHPSFVTIDDINKLMDISTFFIRIYKMESDSNVC